MTRLRLALLVILASVLQVTLFPDLRAFGAVPDVGLVLTVAVAYREGPERGAAFGFATGLVVDLFLRTPLGLSALSFTVVGHAVGLVQSGLSRRPRWAAPVFGGLGGLAGGALFVLVGALAGQDQLLVARSLFVVVVAAGYDALLSFAVFPAAGWATAPDSVVGADGRPR